MPHQSIDNIHLISFGVRSTHTRPIRRSKGKTFLDATSRWPRLPRLKSPPAATSPPASDHLKGGLIYGISAYTLWGIFPIYFRALSHVSPWIILANRIVWSVLFLALIVFWKREWPAIWPVLRSPRSVLLLCLGSILIAINWLIFIYAVTTKQVLQSSLGYFINPLVSIAFGVVFLKEHLRPVQWLAVGVAMAGVANLALRGSALPWIAISLAVSFALYALVRKKVNINSLHGLLVETAVLLPMASSTLVFMPAGDLPQSTWWLLSLAGVITAVPLLLFGAAVRRLKLSTVGFLQYIGPTLQFLLAILLFREPLDSAKLLSFVLCWAAIAIYASDSLRRRTPQVVADEPE